MSPNPSRSIAKKAHSKAEADFATWLMMAKLGGFDDLPSNAQNFLTSYRDRLETMSEAESTALAVREVYNAYYQRDGRFRRRAGTASPQTNDNGQATQRSARSIGCAPFGQPNDPKIFVCPADFREHGGSDCHV